MSLKTLKNLKKYAQKTLKMCPKPKKLNNNLSDVIFYIFSGQICLVTMLIHVEQEHVEQK